MKPQDTNTTIKRGEKKGKGVSGFWSENEFLHKELTLQKLKGRRQPKKLCRTFPADL